MTKHLCILGAQAMLTAAAGLLEVGHQLGDAAKWLTVKAQEILEGVRHL